MTLFSLSPILYVLSEPYPRERGDWLAALIATVALQCALWTAQRRCAMEGLSYYTVEKNPESRACDVLVARR
jgi:hypothetical protein